MHMALIIPPNYAAVIVPIKHSGLNRAAAITFGVVTDPGSNPLTDIEAIQQHTATFLNGLVDSECTIGPAVMRRTPTGGGEPVTFVAATTASGGRSGDSQVPNVALLLHKVTPRGGRSGRGRMFVPWGLSESEVNDVGTLTTTAVNKVQAAANTYLTNLSNAAVDMVLLHNEGSPDANTPSVVEFLRCDPRVGTQRRRMGR
jgi:hypothetical protein